MALHPESAGDICEGSCLADKQSHKQSHLGYRFCAQIWNYIGDKMWPVTENKGLKGRLELCRSGRSNSQMILNFFYITTTEPVHMKQSLVI